MSITIIPFDETLLPAAGKLLAERYQRDRRINPLLPAAFEKPFSAQALVEAAWKKEGARGVAAQQDGQILAYLIGDLDPDPIWGRAAWIRFAGCALAPGQDVELMRELYAALGTHWVARGYFAHFAVIPTADPALLDGWFRLSFGVEQIHALLDLNALDLNGPLDLPPQIEIRQATAADREAVADMSDVIWRRVTKGPAWAIQLPEREADVRTGWAELVDDPVVTLWLAFYQGQLVGTQGYWAVDSDPANPLIGDHYVHMTVAGTREAFRGRGIGRALTQHGLRQARAAGYMVCETDWRSANLEAARLWPRQGFQPVAYRLVRRLDPRIAWANGANHD